VSVYKFLARGAVAPFSGVPWTPSTWIEAAHVCRPGDLAHWLHDELWAVEVDGVRVDGIDCVIVQRARLGTRFDGWHEGGAARFGTACAERAAAQVADAPAELRALADDAATAVTYGYPAVAAHAAALAIARHHTDPAAAYRRERAWQSAWIARDLLGMAGAL
jgi:hypothetical protein